MTAANDELIKRYGVKSSADCEGFEDVLSWFMRRRDRESPLFEARTGRRHNRLRIS